MTETAATQTILSGLEAITDRLEDLYRDVHQHPELSMQEQSTAATAAAQLKGAGYEVTEGVGSTGVVGVLRNGDGRVPPYQRGRGCSDSSRAARREYRGEQWLNWP